MADRELASAGRQAGTCRRAGYRGDGEGDGVEAARASPASVSVSVN